MRFEQRIQHATNALERKLLLAGELTRRLEAEGIRPIVVGGTAVEIYTVGSYQSVDLDLVVSPRERVLKTLETMGFRRSGRIVYHADWGIAVEIPDEQLAGDPQRVTAVEFEGYTLYIIGIEDLICDRLNAAVHWRSQEDRDWARSLLASYREEIDFEYLRTCARNEGTADLLETLLQELDNDA